MSQRILALIIVSFFVFVFAGITINSLYAILTPKKIFASDYSDLEQLAYDSIDIILKNDKEIKNRKILEYKKDINKLTLEEFQKSASQILRGEPIVYPESFRLKVRYKAKSADTNRTNRYKEDWFEGRAYTKVKDGLLMEAGVILINENNHNIMHIPYEFSTDIEGYTISLGIFVTLFIIVAGIWIYLLIKTIRG